MPTLVERQLTCVAAVWLLLSWAGGLTVNLIGPWSCGLVPPLNRGFPLHLVLGQCLSCRLPVTPSMVDRVATQHVALNAGLGQPPTQGELTWLPRTTVVGGLTSSTPTWVTNPGLLRPCTARRPSWEVRPKWFLQFRLAKRIGVRPPVVMCVQPPPPSLETVAE